MTYGLTTWALLASLPLELNNMMYYFVQPSLAFGLGYEIAADNLTDCLRKYKCMTEGGIWITDIFIESPYHVYHTDSAFRLGEEISKTTVIRIWRKLQ